MRAPLPTVALALLLSATGARAEPPNLDQIPFWHAMAGLWAGENTYMDGNLDYKVRAYNSVRQVTLSGHRMRETETKFYAPSALAQGYGQGQLKEGEGIEVTTVTEWEQVDDAGTVRLVSSTPVFGTPPGDTVIRVLDKDTGTRVTETKETGIDEYRMLMTLPTAERCYRLNLGIVAKADGSPGHPAALLGSLRGVSVFRDAKLAAEARAAEVAQDRQRNKVAATVEAGPDGKPVVKRL